MSRAEQYRRLAHQCLETAHTLGHPDARATLLQMAQVWLRLAEEHEGRAPPLAVEESQPVVQQQQQIQPKKDGEKPDSRG